MKSFNCIIHNTTHTSEGGWTYREWDMESGKIYGWGCSDISYPEFTTENIKEERKKYAPDMVQRFREGSLSREFVELYPDQARGMVKEGIITKEQVKKSKYVWKEKEFKYWDKKRKIDANMI